MGVPKKSARRSAERGGGLVLQVRHNRRNAGTHSAGGVRPDEPLPPDRPQIQTRAKMPLTLADVHRIARLARIQITDQQATAAVTQLNDIFAMIEQIGRVDTTGVAPMTHPLDGTQRLREDQVEPPPPGTIARLRAEQDRCFA